ncbi:MAG TPA: GerMN domain-containing protein [Leptolyngbyaceae cyanobacterium M33_DOE_097]|uniref:Sporulation/spore germination protein n=1 Tax=Oscillatoriales cyanobacterium SpSt-418 TaxID=2282169 RepID=A0A7C3PJX9_9CYAN|nr:GerMN domain-containing protein [Leptolyngbyaceae cyanobacterium M33_DOE_097]
MKNRFPITIGLLVLISTSLLSCADSNLKTAPDSAVSPSAEPTPSATVSPLTPNASPTPKSSASTGTSNKAADKEVATTVYMLDNQCNLVAKKVMLPSDDAMEEAIAQVIKPLKTKEFSVSDYSVKVSDGVATVDLQTPADSPRTFESLSSCEQTALFEGIQQTLTANAAWKIKDVQFTQKGEELVH